MATVTSLSFSIFARYHGGGAMAAARRDIDSLNDRANRMNRTLGGSSGAMMSMTRAATMLAPALIPVGVAAVGVAGGLAAAAATAGLAAGVFGALSLTATKNAAKMGAAGRAYIVSLTGVKRAWMELARATAPDTLRPLTTVLDGVTAAIGRLRPLVKATSPVFQELANKMKLFMSGSGFKGMVDLAIKFGVPALRNMTRAAFDLFIVFTRLIKAFAPFGVVVTDQLRKGAAALRQWADNGGFERFMKSVQQNGPLVRQFFQALVPAMVNLFKAVSPLGPVMLRLVTLFLRMAAALPTPLLTALIIAYEIYTSRLLIATVLTKSWLVLTLAVRVATAIWTIAQYGLNVAITANPIGVLILAIGALIAAIAGIVIAIFALIKHWRGVWTAMKVVAFAVWFAMKVVFQAMVWFFTVAIPSAARFMGKVVTAAWRFIYSVILGVFNFLRDHVFKAMDVFFVKYIPAAASFLWRAIVGAWRSFGSIVNTVYVFLRDRVFKAMDVFFVKYIPAAAVFMWHVVGHAWSAVSGAIAASFRFMVNAVFKPLGVFFTKIIPKAANVLWHAMVFSFTKAVQGIKFVWDKLRGILKAPISFFVKTIYNGGIVPAWNNTIGRIPGVPNLPKAKGFATGGMVTGRGGPKDDMVHAMLSPGEYVINASSAKAIGYSNLAALNTAQGNQYLAEGGKVNSQGVPGFALGGIIPNPIDVIKKIGGGIAKGAKFVAGIVKKGFNWATDFTISVAGPIVKKLLSPFRSLLKGVQHKYGSTPPNRLGGGGANIVVGAGNAALDALAAFAESHAADDTGGGGFAMGLKWAKGQSGKKYQWGGNGNPSWDCSGFMSAIESVIRGQKPHRRWATGSFGGRKAAPGWALNRKSPFQIGVTNKGVGHTAGTLNGVNVECSGGKGCHWGKGARGAKDKMFDGVYGFDPKLATGGSAGHWGPLVQTVMAALHQPNSHVGDVLKCIQKESGGNPAAVNTWDSNAKRGTPSKGLVQVILPTFNAFAGKYKSRGILDPFANVYAGCNYAIHRYGGGWSKRMAAPGGYASGGLVTSYDSGGYLPEGLSMAYNGTGAPEPVGHGLGGDVVFNGPVYVKSEREFREMVIEAYAEAKRRKRV